MILNPPLLPALSDDFLSPDAKYWLATHALKSISIMQEARLQVSSQALNVVENFAVFA